MISSQLNSVKVDPAEDERLATFVVASHRRHHPDVDQTESEESQQVSAVFRFFYRNESASFKSTLVFQSTEVLPSPFPYLSAVHQTVLPLTGFIVMLSRIRFFQASF